jgi:hypothetical protein
MKKLSVNELLRRACYYAEQDRDSFIQAHKHMPNDEFAVEAIEFLSQLKAYRQKRWGKFYLEGNDMKSVQIEDIL